VGFVEGFARAARFYRQNRLPTLTTLRAPCVPHNLFIVTDSNVALGKEAARHFTRLGASEIILAVRNSKAKKKLRRISRVVQNVAPTSSRFGLLASSRMSPVSHSPIEPPSSHVLTSCSENAGIAG
jgi:hypothetical protein